MRRQVRVVVVGLGLALLGVAIGLQPGCTKKYPYDLRGVVRSAADGRPLAGATVEVEGQSVYPQAGFPATAGADGSFAGRFQVSGHFDAPDLPKWSATVSRDGFETEVVDISPRQMPASGETPTQVMLVVYLRPKAP